MRNVSAWNVIQLGSRVTEVITNAFERHAQTALVMLLVALLLWVGNTTQKTSVAVAEMRVEITYLKTAIEDTKDN